MDNNKLQELRKYSNPEEVAKIGKKNNLDIYVSSRKDKKYMIKIGNESRHFGQMGYEDYTLTKDNKKRDLFRKRNAKWGNAEKFTPAWLSYHILW